MSTAFSAATIDIAQGYRQSIDDFVADAYLSDAIKTLMDFVKNLTPFRQSDVVAIKNRFNRWEIDEKAGNRSTDRATAIRSAVLALSDQVFDYTIEQVDYTIEQVDAAVGVRLNAGPAGADSSTGNEHGVALFGAALAVPVAPTNSPLAEQRRALIRGDPSYGELRACVCRQVSRVHTRGRFTLRPLDIDLIAGDIIGIVGRNGSGKTTLLKLLMGELNPTSGNVIYPSLTRDGNGWKHIKSQIAYVSQEPARWHGRLRQTLNFVAATNARAGQDAYEAVAACIARYDLEPFADMTWNEISGGYKTRFELARALVARPKILFLDEPLANLDVVARGRFLQDLKEIATSLRDPLPIVITSQHLNELEAIANQIVILEGGDCLYSGPVDALGETRTDRLVEIAVRMSLPGEIEAVLGGLGLGDLEITLEGYILSLPENVDIVDVFRRLSVGFGPRFTGLRDITSSSRAMIRETRH